MDEHLFAMSTVQSVQYVWISDLYLFAKKKYYFTYHSMSLPVIFVYQENELQTIVPEEIGILFSKLFCPTMRKNSSSD